MCRSPVPSRRPPRRRRRARAGSGDRRARRCPGRSTPRARARARGNTRWATSRSSTRTIPLPIAPNSGLTTTSPPSCSNASDRVVEALAHDRRWRRHPGLGQRRASPRLVDRPLDGAGRVDAPDSERGQHVQRIHPEDDLLERPAGQSPDDQQHRVRRARRHRVRAHAPRPLVDLGAQSRGGDGRRLVAAIGQRPEQCARMP